jgi:hypothetical protein
MSSASVLGVDGNIEQVRLVQDLPEAKIADKFLS